MMTKIVRVLGVLFFVSLSAISIFFALAGRDLDNPKLQRLVSIPAFFEDRFYDIRMQQTLHRNAPDPRLVLAEIDDDSIQKIGTWPLPRTAYATMLDKLRSFGAKVVAFDVFFPEPAPSCGENRPDSVFAKAIQDFTGLGGGKVVLAYSLNVDGAKTEREFEELPEDLYNFVMDTKQAQGVNLKEMTVSRDIYPIRPLIEAGASLAHIETVADSDGIFRHYGMVGNVGDIYLPSFSLLTYEAFTGDKPILELFGLGEANLKLKHGSIKLNAKGETKVRWLGDGPMFPRANLYSIMQAKEDDQKMKQLFEGKVVFVASTAFGAHDIRHTPVNPQMPGVYFHMNALNMLLEGRFFRSQADSTTYSWAILIAGTLLMLLVQLAGNAVLDLGVALILSVGLYLLDTYWLLPQGLEIKLFFCLFSIVSCYSWNTFLSFYLANKDKAFLKNAFGNYISPELIDIMYKNGEAPKLGGDQGVRTAFFTDIAGFSTFSEKLSPTQLVELLNEYLTAMTDILLEEGGTLDKYEGDAIIAFFGAPLPMEDHAVRACRVAHRMQEKLAQLREKWKGEGEKWPKIVHEMRMRIGINSGEIVTGNMGSKSRMNYTMMGDAVNLAARLEAAAKQYGIFTQVSEATKNLAGEGLAFRELDKIRVVGKSEPVTTFDLLGPAEGLPSHLQELKKAFEEGRALYNAQKWDQAIEAFKRAQELEHKRFPELTHKPNPSKIYIERCEEFKKLPPPPDWDGVYTLTEK